MIDEDFEVVKVSLTVITPRATQNLLDIWMLTLAILTHIKWKALQATCTMNVWLDGYDYAREEPQVSTQRIWAHFQKR